MTKKRRIKKPKEYKTMEERQKWSERIVILLNELGLTEKNDATKSFLIKLTHFVKTGDSDTGSILIEDDPHKRKICYIFSNRKHIICSVGLIK